MCNNSGPHDITIKPKIQLKKINTDLTAGNDALKVSGEFISGTAFSELAPMTDGARVILLTADGDTIADVTVPGGAAWSANGSGTKWSFKDSLGVNNGLTKLQIQDRSKIAANQVKVKVQGKDGRYPAVAGDEPVKAIVVIGDGSVSRCTRSARA
jgi:hypothetical protein